MKYYLGNLLFIEKILNFVKRVINIYCICIIFDFNQITLSGLAKGMGLADRSTKINKF